VWERWRKAKELNDRGSRADEDSEDKIARRLKEFSEKTAPVIAFYESRGLLIRVNGDQPRDAVTLDIFAGLATFAAGHPS